MKQQLIVAFEQWYADNFEQGAGAGNLDITGQSDLDRHEDETILGGATYKGESMIGMHDEIDEEAEAFKRAKKHIENLHRAKKLERMGKAK